MGATIGTRIHTWLNGRKAGEDEFGNRYYIAKKIDASSGRYRRWVIYNGIVEPSKVPALWHGWLSYTIDEAPSDNPRTPYAWEKQHQPNLTGTKHAYVPAGHVRAGGKRAASASDYEAWTPDA